MTSGGLDSTVLVYWAISKGYSTVPIFINYGQHCAETELCTLRDVLPSFLQEKLCVLNVSDVFGSSKSRLIRTTDLWCERISSDDIMLPYRNLFLLVVGAAFTASRGANTLLSAFINSNHAYELDATTEFLLGVDNLIATTGGVSVEMPFRELTKAQVVELGIGLGVPISRTFSCQVNAKEHCGACPNCVERLLAFSSGRV